MEAIAGLVAEAREGLEPARLVPRRQAAGPA